MNFISPRFFGVLFCVSNLLASTACKKASGTPDWDTPGVTEPSSAKVVSPAPAYAVPSVQTKSEPTLATHSTETAEIQPNGGASFHHLQRRELADDGSLR